MTKNTDRCVESGVLGMSALGAAVAEAAAPARSSPPPRLLLRERGAGAGSIDGAWWPRTGDPTSELHELIGVLATRLGQLVRIGFDWRAAESDTDPRGCPPPPHHACRSRNGAIMHLYGQYAVHLALLVIPADAEPGLAEVEMRWAAGQPLSGDRLIAATPQPGG
ncbi:hypothetical protein GZH49_36400 [Nocardia terpenica]|uniref:DUF5994 family protein n=1 Tax=Nocardia terpenica TaxID=455432 RepID=UPI002FE38529